MNPVEIIGKKRDGIELTREEIRYFIEQFIAGSIPDYQVSAWAMAIYMRGMSREETVELTMALAESGEIIDLSPVLKFAIDKHSSGGVGDKTSLVALPLVVSFGVPVAKMSGRGLSLTGGTLDKMESISGYNVNLSMKEFMDQIDKYGIVLAGQTADLAPADGKLYALRDVTATVSSKPLIASSIMSKKIASGADAVVLDVKAGLGAFMQTVEDAEDLAQIMVDIGKGAGKKVTALISDMNQPLGYAIGNALEVREAIDTLQGTGPADLVEHCIVVAGQMLRLAGISTARDLSDIRERVEEKLSNGEAWEKFRTLVRAQGGDLSQIDQPDTLPRAPVVIEERATRSGYLQTINAREIGFAVLHLGAGRQVKDATIDHAVGAVVHHKVGEYVRKGERLFTIHARDADSADVARSRILNAHVWSERPGMPLFYNTLFSE
nr:thymidine phosphorylase [Anaerolineae bacterium]